jgi:hypothetical protein
LRGGRLAGWVKNLLPRRSRSPQRFFKWLNASPGAKESGIRGDGRRVKSVIATNVGSTTTLFIGAHYEVTGSTITKYYFAGGTRIAMRKDGALYYLLGDHLGSTSIVTDANGVVVSETKYSFTGSFCLVNN